MGERQKPYLILMNGPNLNRLGVRETAVYGKTTLSEVVTQVRQLLDTHGVDLKDYQSNSEGALIDFLQAYGPSSSGIIINPGAFGHYSIALRDCLADIAKPTVEVHISNVFKREPFRHESVLAAVVTGQIVGLGTAGYELAARYLLTQCLQ
jgi:3-dehydroquinate dehydratase II